MGLLVILGIDHIGLATDDAAGAGAFLTALGMRQTDTGIAEAYGVSCEFWAYDSDRRDLSRGGWPAIETVCPLRADSSVTGRLARNGPGLYHVAFTVDDIGAEILRLREHGFAPIDTHPQIGAREGMQVAFMYAPKPASILIELVRYGRPG
jgi:methylmalonyl-CoA/ethylmalonyl-CoA epimerase